jgi:hypothetical protein
MPVPECPRCHKRASLADQQPYCINCGWNRDVAIGALRRKMKMLPVGVVLFAGFFLFVFYVWQFRNAAQLAISVTVPAIGLLANYFVYRNQLAKLQALPPSASSAATATTGGTGSSGGFGGSSGLRGETVQHDPPYDALSSVPRPRRIRMARRGQVGIAVGVIFVAVAATFLGIALYSRMAPAGTFPTVGEKGWLLAGLLAMMVLVPYAMWRAQARECDLLQNGEIAEGHVTKQWLNKGNSSIAYEFTDFRGDRHRGLGNDYTKKLYVGMPLAVFYDSNNPKRQVAYCSTLHEIIV